MSIKTIAVILIIFSVGCAKPCLPKMPDCPPAPDYPKIKDKELDSISNETYVKLVDLISLRDEYINKLSVYCNES